MNKFLTLAVLTATVALGAATAEAAGYYAPAKHTTVMEGRNAADTFAARSGATAIDQQAALNARATR